jgi:hypothetical protein
VPIPDDFDIDFSLDRIEPCVLRRPLAATSWPEGSASYGKNHSSCHLLLNLVYRRKRGRRYAEICPQGYSAVYSRVERSDSIHHDEYIEVFRYKQGLPAVHLLSLVHRSYERSLTDKISRHWLFPAIL